MKKIGFIGMGNMGYAILQGVLSKYAKEDLIFSSKSQEKKERIKAKTGVDYTEDNASLAKNCEILVLAIKPQMYDTVFLEIAKDMPSGQVVISLAPGKSIDELKSKLGDDKRIVRAMPNTPALLGESMTGIAWIADEFSKVEKEGLIALFDSFGKSVVVEERLMDAVVSVSGSSPAFAYMFIDALADAGVKYGLKKSEAIQMAAQTLLGSAKMVLESGEHPAVLKDKVCSPGGTTIAGVAALEESGFRASILAGAEAVYQKCTKIK